LRKLLFIFWAFDLLRYEWDESGKSVFGLKSPSQAIKNFMLEHPNFKVGGIINT